MAFIVARRRSCTADKVVKNPGLGVTAMGHTYTIGPELGLIGSTYSIYGRNQRRWVRKCRNQINNTHLLLGDQRLLQLASNIQRQTRTPPHLRASFPNGSVTSGCIASDCFRFQIASVCFIGYSSPLKDEPS